MSRKVFFARYCTLNRIDLFLSHYSKRQMNDYQFIGIYKVDANIIYVASFSFLVAMH